MQWCSNCLHNARFAEKKTALKRAMLVRNEQGSSTCTSRFMPPIKTGESGILRHPAPVGSIRAHARRQPVSRLVHFLTIDTASMRVAYTSAHLPMPYWARQQQLGKIRRCGLRFGNSTVSRLCNSRSHVRCEIHIRGAFSLYDIRHADKRLSALSAPEAVSLKF